MGAGKGTAGKVSYRSGTAFYRGIYYQRNRYDFEENEYTIEELKELYPLKRNEKGLTYGLHLYNPDLVMAYAANGETGYVYQSDLDAVPGSDVKNPSEAMEYMKWKEENDFQYVIKVYKADGETVIGEMVIDY